MSNKLTSMFRVARLRWNPKTSFMRLLDILIYFFAFMRAGPHLFFSDLVSFEDDLVRSGILKKDLFENLTTTITEALEYCLCQQMQRDNWGLSTHYLREHQMLMMFDPQVEQDHFQCNQFEHPYFAKSIPIMLSFYYLQQCNSSKHFKIFWVKF